METAGARLGLDFNRAGTIAAVLRAVVGGKHLEFGDGVNAGINVQRGVAAVVHGIAAVHLPVVIFGSATIYAKGNIAGNADPGFILSRLIADAGYQGDELGEISPVEFELADLFAGDCSSQIRGLGFDLGD